jgi:hypothetical protein
LLCGYSRSHAFRDCSTELFWRHLRESSRIGWQ